MQLKKDDLTRVFCKNSKFIIFILAIFVFLFLFLKPFQFAKQNNLKQSIQVDGRKFYDHQLIEIQLGQKVLTVEVVNTSASITQGLSGREELGSDGMLFIFTDKRQVNFWMKDMLFDLDFIWLADNCVVGVTEKVIAPPLGTTIEDLDILSPPQAVDMVLEVSAGQVQAWGIKLGDKLVLAK